MTAIMLLAVICLAGPQVQLDPTGNAVLPDAPDYASVELTTGISWELDFLSDASGVDFAEVDGRSVVLIVSQGDHRVYWFDVQSGEVIDTTEVCSQSDNPWGVILRDDSIWVNDWIDDHVYYKKLGELWHGFESPGAGIWQAGMDDERWQGYFWMASASTAIRFDPYGGGGGSSWELGPYLTEGEGISCFSCQGHMWLAVTELETDYVFFYWWTASGIEYVCQSDIPWINWEYSKGITYDYVGDSFWWICKHNSGSYYLCEMDYEVTDLEASTWGEIKSVWSF